MLPKSIRSQLPLTYAGIALVATLALGAVLLLTLRGYYSQQEIEYLQGNAQVISQVLSSTYASATPQPSQVQSQIQSLSFLTQARIKVLDNQSTVIADSGSFQDKQTVSISLWNRILTTPSASTTIPSQDEHFYAVTGTTSSATAPVAGQVVGTENGMFIGQGPLMVSELPKQTVQETSLSAPSAPAQDFTVAVAGTPYGFGLNADMDTRVRSDQMVETPLVTPDHTIGFVQLSEGPAYGTEIVQGVARALIGAGAFAVLIAAGVGWIVSRHMSAPLDVLTRTTLQMANGDLSARVHIPRRDEFGQLAQTFNEMAGQVETTITALQRFVADAAHELHTPLTAVRANLELAASELDTQSRARFLDQGQIQLKRLEALTNNLLDLSRIESHTLRDEGVTVDLVQLMQETSELHASRAEQKEISFEFKAPSEPIRVQISEGQFRRVLDNLLDNAIKFTPENGTVRLGICREGCSVRLWVQDTGIGIPPEDLPYVFSRFRRGRNAANYPGSGLGLAITQAIVEAHHGKVSVESHSSGTHFCVEIPALAGV